MIVTTSQNPSEASFNKALQLANELQAVFISRKQMTVSKLLTKSEDGKALIVTENELRFYDINSEHSSKPLTYHPSMAFIKLKRLLKGDTDPMLSFAECKLGDSVLDCTAGLCSDSLLFSFGVGDEGKVVALESEPVLYTLVREGLATYPCHISDIEKAMRRIELACYNHDDYLKSLPDSSFDIVYFDPMFRQPIHDSAAIRAISGIANRNAISEEMITEAQRVAKKCVILKENAKSDEFHRLGFHELKISQGSKIAYGKINCEKKA